MPNGFIETGVPGIFGLPEPQEPGIGHTASCIQECRFAYLAGTARGIQIVDLRDPANPKKAGQFVPAITGLATHDVQVDRKGLAWIAGADGTAAYDVSNPLQPRMVMRTDESHQELGPARAPGPRPGLRHRRRGRDPDRPDPPQQPALLEAARGDHRGGLQPARPARAPARSRPGGSSGRRLALLDLFTTELDNLVQGKGWAPVDRPLLGALLRRARRARGDRLVRGGHALPRRARPGRHPPGGLLGADEGRDLVRATSRRPTRPARSSTRSTSRAASTCSASTAATAACGARRCGARGCATGPARRAPAPGARASRAGPTSASSAGCRASAQRHGAEAGAARHRACRTCPCRASRARLARGAGEVALARRGPRRCACGGSRAPRRVRGGPW